MRWQKEKYRFFKWKMLCLPNYFPLPLSVFYPHHLALKKELEMTIMTFHQPILSLIAGILILLIPRLLNYIVAIYLIIIGIVGLTR